MPNIDQKRLDKIYKVIHSTNQRGMLLNFKKEKTYTYTELKNYFGNRSSSFFSYYLRILTNTHLIKKDQSRYFLTRAGIQVVNLIKKFEKTCMEYDIDDCAEDGTIDYIINGRKIKK